MTEKRSGDAASDRRIEIEPEPTADELVAILEAIGLLHEETDESEKGGGAVESPWTRTARREGMRPSQWVLPTGGWGSSY